jgi:hypothetical protein
MVVDLLIDNQDGVVKWFLGVYFLLACWEMAKQIKWKINNKSLPVANFAIFCFKIPLEIEISHLNWDFQRFPWYFSIGLIFTNKVELPIVKHTLMIKYLCISCSFIGFLKGIFKVMGAPNSGLQYLWEFQRQRRTKKSMKWMICANHKMFEKKRALDLFL